MPETYKNHIGPSKPQADPDEVYIQQYCYQSLKEKIDEMHVDLKGRELAKVCLSMYDFYRWGMHTPNHGYCLAFAEAAVLALEDEIVLKGSPNGYLKILVEANNALHNARGAAPGLHAELTKSRKQGDNLSSEVLRRWSFPDRGSFDWTVYMAVHEEEFYGKAKSATLGVAWCGSEAGGSSIWNEESSGTSDEDDSIGMQEDDLESELAAAEVKAGEVKGVDGENILRKYDDTSAGKGDNSGGGKSVNVKAKSWVDGFEALEKQQILEWEEQAAALRCAAENVEKDVPSWKRRATELEHKVKVAEQECQKLRQAADEMKQKAMDGELEMLNWSEDAMNLEQKAADAEEESGTCKRKASNLEQKAALWKGTRMTLP